MFRKTVVNRFVTNGRHYLLSPWSEVKKKRIATSFLFIFIFCCCWAARIIAAARARFWFFRAVFTCLLLTKIFFLARFPWGNSGMSFDPMNKILKSYLTVWDGSCWESFTVRRGEIFQWAEDSALKKTLVQRYARAFLSVCVCVSSSSGDQKQFRLRKAAMKQYGASTGKFLSSYFNLNVQCI